MSNTVTVGIADFNVVKTPDVLVTYALGSCVGICLYDANARIAGLAHIMLPDSNLIAVSYTHLDDNFGVRITEIIGTKELLSSLEKQQ